MCGIAGGRVTMEDFTALAGSGARDGSTALAGAVGAGSS